MNDNPWKRRQAVTPQSIREAAIQLFVQKGFDSTTMVEIAEFVGVSPQTVLNHFPKKTDLFFDKTGWLLDGPPRAIRGRGTDQLPVDAVLAWFLEYLERRDQSGQLRGLAGFFATVEKSATLYRRYLHDMAYQAQAIQIELDHAMPDAPRWQIEFASCNIVSTMFVCEREVSRLIGSVDPEGLLAAAREAVKEIFSRCVI